MNGYRTRSRVATCSLLAAHLIPLIHVYSFMLSAHLRTSPSRIPIALHDSTILLIRFIVSFSFASLSLTACACVSSASVLKSRSRTASASASVHSDRLQTSLARRIVRSRSLRIAETASASRCRLIVCTLIAFVSPRLDSEPEVSLPEPESACLTWRALQRLSAVAFDANLLSLCLCLCRVFHSQRGVKAEH